MTDKLSKIFDITPVEAAQLPALILEDGNAKLTDDSNFARANLKQLIGTAQQALEHALECAVQSESPRAFEVLANMINTAADLNTKLIDIHQREQRISNKPAEVAGTTNVTNNVVFAGTTSDLNSMIAKRMLQNETK